MLALDGDMTSFGCGSARYHFTNLDDNSTTSVKSEAGAGTGIVPPGRYLLTKVQCAVWGTGGWHIPAGGWFSPVAVHPGEIVYLGTLIVVPFSKTAPAGLLQSPEMQLEWGQVPTYTIRDEMDAARKVLRPEIGDLVDRMVARSPRVLLSEKALADAVQRAYQPDANGVMPTNARAKASVVAELNKIGSIEGWPGGS